MTLYKVLESGRSCNGGDLAWSLPTESGPGDWHEVSGTLELCERGLHLTDDPVRWYQQGRDVYLAEAEGVEGDCDNPDRKCVARRVRLTRKLTDAELAEVRIYRYGAHEIREGICFASGSASVRASGSASVTAYDSASVRASGSASVRASGSASVRAFRSATVVSWWGSCTVLLGGPGAVHVNRSVSPPVTTVGGTEVES